jgi:hypothetical protein
LQKEILLKEIKKYENIKSQPSKVLLLANEYAKVLKNVGEILRKQKVAIGYFGDRIEVIRDEGVARCYFYKNPRMKEVDYFLPSNGVCVPQYGAEGGIPAALQLNLQLTDSTSEFLRVQTSFCTPWRHIRHILAYGLKKQLLLPWHGLNK